MSLCVIVVVIITIVVIVVVVITIVVIVVVSNYKYMFLIMYPLLLVNYQLINIGIDTLMYYHVSIILVILIMVN